MNILVADNTLEEFLIPKPAGQHKVILMGKEENRRSKLNKQTKANNLLVERKGWEYCCENSKGRTQGCEYLQNALDEILKKLIKICYFLKITLIKLIFLKNVNFLIIKYVILLFKGFCSYMFPLIWNSWILAIGCVIYFFRSVHPSRKHSPVLFSIISGVCLFQLSHTYGVDLFQLFHTLVNNWYCKSFLTVFNHQFHWI